MKIRMFDALLGTTTLFATLTGCVTEPTSDELASTTLNDVTDNERAEDVTAKTPSVEDRYADAIHELSSQAAGGDLPTSSAQGAPRRKDSNDDDAADPALASPVVGTTPPALASRCGEWLEPHQHDEGGHVVFVYYRHCTSGRDSLRVKANIRWWPDGPCTTVGPNETKLIDTYPVPPGTFSHIDRC